MSKKSWGLIVFLASLLIVIPSTLAFLTSFYTPIIGLSCRSMTFLSYMLCQLWLIALSVWDIESTYVEDVGQGDQGLVQHIPVRRIDSASRRWSLCLWYFLATINVGVALFMTIGGTMMQIMGVYRNCRCRIPITSWHNPDNSMINISTNSAEDISYALHVWRGTGAGAVVFLGFVTFLGWWYVYSRIRRLYSLAPKPCASTSRVVLTRRTSVCLGFNVVSAK